MARYTNSTPGIVNMLLRLTYFFLLSLARALSPISIKASKLYDDEGRQFFVKGIIYYLGTSAYIWKRSANSSGVMYHLDATSGKDILANTAQCQIDAGLIKDLGANTIRVYAIDATEDHDGCMKAFASQGIYV